MFIASFLKFTYLVPLYIKDVLFGLISSL